MSTVHSLALRGYKQCNPSIAQSLLICIYMLTLQFIDVCQNLGYSLIEDGGYFLPNLNQGMETPGKFLILYNGNIVLHGQLFDSFRYLSRTFCKQFRCPHGNAVIFNGNRESGWVGDYHIGLRNRLHHPISGRSNQ
jgi:hypothetical protein